MKYVVCVAVAAAIAVSSSQPVDAQDYFAPAGPGYCIPLGPCASFTSFGVYDNRDDVENWGAVLNGFLFGSGLSPSGGTLLFGMVYRFSNGEVSDNRSDGHGYEADGSFSANGFEWWPEIGTPEWDEWGAPVGYQLTHMYIDDWYCTVGVDCVRVSEPQTLWLLLFPVLLALVWRRRKRSAVR